MEHLPSLPGKCRITSEIRRVCIHNQSLGYCYTIRGGIENGPYGIGPAWPAGHGKGIFGDLKSYPPRDTGDPRLGDVAGAGLIRRAEMCKMDTHIYVRDGVSRWPEFS